MGIIRNWPNIRIMPAESCSSFIPKTRSNGIAWSRFPVAPIRASNCLRSAVYRDALQSRHQRSQILIPENLVQSLMLLEHRVVIVQGIIGRLSDASIPQCNQLRIGGIRTVLVKSRDERLIRCRILAHDDARGYAVGKSVLELR